ncbi:MAG: hypothetical protein PHW07_03815 [Sulfurospirillaceae bacterium]|nr:hypothetical protein [Sulfurospirillaceae bacterium]
MVGFRVDKEKNILFVTISGEVMRDKAQEYIAQFAEKAAELKDNFAIISDYSLFKATSEKDYELICKVTATMSAKFKIGKIIRVVGGAKENLAGFKKYCNDAHIENISYVATKKAALDLVNKQ